MSNSFDWKKARWQYIGWSRVDWGRIQGEQFVIMEVRGMVLTVLERHSPLSDAQLSSYMQSEMGYSMTIEAVRNHLKTLNRYGLVKLVLDSADVQPIEPQNRQPELIKETVRQVQPSHFLDTAFLTKGKVAQHSRTKLGIMIVAAVEAGRDNEGKTVIGRKFAYVLPGKTETTNDLIKVLDLVQKHQRITCLQTDGRPLYRSGKFQAYLANHSIKIVMQTVFGSMAPIDRIFGQWKSKYVHPKIREIEGMNLYDRFEYVVGTLKDCFPDMTVNFPSVTSVFGSKE
jgi:Ribonuclease R winged-helix domain